MDYMDLLEEKIRAAKSDLKLQKRNLTDTAFNGMEWRHLLFNKFTGIGLLLLVFLLLRKKVFRKILGRIPLVSIFFKY